MNLFEFLRDHSDGVAIVLALVVLAQAVIIFLWARRDAALKRRLDDALGAAENARAIAATALAADEAVHEAVEVASRGEEAPAETAVEPEARPVGYRVRGGPARAAETPTPAEPAEPVETPAPAPVPAVPAGDDAVRNRRSVAAAAWAQPASAQMTSDPMQAADAADDGEAAPWVTVPPGEPEQAAAPGTGTNTAGEAVEQSWVGTSAETMLDEPAGSAAAETPASPTPSATTGGNGASTPDLGVAHPIRPSWPRRDAGNDVLLVEDDDNVARLYRILLESRGYELRHAADGALGLDEAHRQRPDLILLDVMMPRMNGITFLQELRNASDLDDVPVVILSNFREKRLVDQAMALGALEYMVKAQARPEALVTAIPRWIRGERAFTL